MDTTEQAKPRLKPYTFKTSMTLTGGHSGVLSSEGKPSILISHPREFKGEPGLWSPEEMFVASVEACQMSTFLLFAAKKAVQILEYRSHSNGVLESVDGDYRFTRIVIFPTITVAKAAIEEDVHALLREAEKHCLVANSIASIVEVNPTIILR